MEKYSTTQQLVEPELEVVSVFCMTSSVTQLIKVCKHLLGSLKAPLQNLGCFHVTSQCSTARMQNVDGGQEVRGGSAIWKNTFVLSSLRLLQSFWEKEKGHYEELKTGMHKGVERSKNNVIKSGFKPTSEVERMVKWGIIATLRHVPVIF